MIVNGGKPSDVGAGCAWGLLLIPVVFFGGAWLLGQLVAILTWLFG